jgi:hypothetical protein
MTSSASSVGNGRAFGSGLTPLGKTPAPSRPRPDHPTAQHRNATRPGRGRHKAGLVLGCPEDRGAPRPGWVVRAEDRAEASAPVGRRRQARDLAGRERADDRRDRRSLPGAARGCSPPHVGDSARQRSRDGLQPLLQPVPGNKHSVKHAASGWGIHAPALDAEETPALEAGADPTVD